MRPKYMRPRPVLIWDRGRDQDQLLWDRDRDQKSGLETIECQACMHSYSALLKVTGLTVYKQVA